MLGVELDSHYLDLPELVDATGRSVALLQLLGLALVHHGQQAIGGYQLQFQASLLDWCL